jgi:hypothetical protein
VALQLRVGIGLLPQRLLVVQRHQRQRGQRRGVAERRLRRGAVGPQPRPVVVVEGHHRAAPRAAAPPAASSRSRAAGGRMARLMPLKYSASMVGLLLQRRVAVGVSK